MYQDEQGQRHSTVTEFGIYGFFGQGYRFLSNFAAAPLELDGIRYPTSEHAYMAEKVIDREERLRLAALPTPGAARRAGQLVVMRSDWDIYKPHAMLRVVRAKFRQNPDLAQRLLDTGTRYLSEDNSWGDRYWGVVQGEGLNMLGKTLMQVRDELRRYPEGLPANG